MELLHLKEKVLSLFKIKEVEELPGAIETILFSESKNEIFEKYLELVENDLTKDHLQKIYQYYLADREGKNQDFTPLSLARFAGMLSGDADTVVDMCAGSGALTIQKWILNKNKEFLLYELDENAIPFLIFNMAIRNIKCIIHQADVLQMEIYKTYQIDKGDKYGIIKETGNGAHTNF